MITRKQLLETEYKYLNLEVQDAEPGEKNNAFNELLLYIGKNYPVDYLKGIEHDYAYYHSAYSRIKKEVRRILYPHGWSERKLKLSNKEINAIRSFYQDEVGGRRITFARIPYKVATIFNAIILILEEIWSVSPAPIETDTLSKCIGKTYKIAFYRKQIDAYISPEIKSTFTTDEVIKKSLDDDLNCDVSPFQKIFKR